MPTLSFRQGANGYTGTVDTVLKEANPTNSYATNIPLYVDGGAGANLQSLIYFKNLFGSGQGQVPLGATITSATLTVETTNATGGSASFHRMLFDWTSLPTWSWNAFGAGVQFDGTEALSTADLTAGKIALGTREFDVTSSVQAWAAGAANFGWAVRTGSTDSWAFTSSEGAIRPLLTINYTVDAPPPTAGFSVVRTNGAVAEGGATDSFTMALTSAPIEDVVVNVVGNADLDAAPTTLTFTPANWSTPQTVTVSAVNDQLVEGTETRNITFAVSSADTRYDDFAVAPVSETITDNDAPPGTPPPIDPQVVRVTDVTKYKTGDPSGYGIGDPSGLAYVPGRGLFIADSEHDESPYNSSTNLWAIGIDGSSIGAYSLRSFTSEPTGLAYNPLNGFLYITDDDKRKVFWVDPLNPAVKKGEFSVSGLGITDAEDPKIDPVTGHIYMLDGVSRSLFELSSTGSLIRSFTLPSAITDAEGLAYSAQHDVFFVSSGATRGTIFELDGNGKLLDTINTLNSSAYNNPAYGSRPYLKGLELAPSSNPNDGDRLSLYAVDYGKDQKADGRLFELDLGSGWTSGTGSSTLVATNAVSEPTLDARQSSQATVSETVFGTASDGTGALGGDDLGELAASLLDDGSDSVGEVQQSGGRTDIASDLGGHPSAGWDELVLVQNMLGEPPSGQLVV